MRIKKGLFITEIEISLTELNQIWCVTPKPLLSALLEWMKKYLDFVLPTQKTKE